jgi:hypothetical protein
LTRCKCSGFCFFGSVANVFAKTDEETKQDRRQPGGVTWVMQCGWISSGIPKGDGDNPGRATTF